MELKLMELRKKAGYKNRDDFAEAIGVNRHTYRTWETGRTEISLIEASKIADFLHCTLDELAGREVPNRATVDEQKMLKEFRTLDLKQQAIVKQTIHTMTPRYHEDMEKKAGADKAG